MPYELDDIERRVLGVLVEKGYTTPDQYPLSLNAAVVGSNQKSCRDPILDIDEVDVLEALDTLREKKLAVCLRPTGSRTDRYRHCVPEEMEIDAKGAAVLAELLLRGPQTDGELRQRANRMVRIGSRDELQAVLEALRRREPPLVVRLSPEGQRRGVVYTHNLFQEGEAPSPETVRVPEASPPAPRSTPSPPTPAIATELADIRREIEDLKQRIAHLEGM